MTMAEVRACLEAQRRRERRDMEKRAWAVAHLLSPYAKEGQTITVQSLLGGPKPLSADDFADPRAFAKAAEALAVNPLAQEEQEDPSCQ